MNPTVPGVVALWSHCTYPSHALQQSVVPAVAAGKWHVQIVDLSHINRSRQARVGHCVVASSPEPVLNYFCIKQLPVNVLKALQSIYDGCLLLLDGSLLVGDRQWCMCQSAFHYCAVVAMLSVLSALGATPCCFAHFSAEVQEAS